jgi:uncharacterized membrane protein HdeD (DUF308 family)
MLTTVKARASRNSDGLGPNTSNASEFFMADTNQAATNTSRATYSDPARTDPDGRPAEFDLSPDKWWVSLILGLLLIAAGIYMVFHAIAASIATSIVFGAILLVGGIFQVVHTFWENTWRSRILSVIIGLLFAGSGVLLLLDPLAGSVGLTLAFAVMFIAGGVLRLVLAYRLWRRVGWLLLLSGLIAMATGAIIVLGWPWSGLVIPGLMVGIDMVFYGAWWAALGMTLRRERPALSATHPAHA